MNGLVTVGLPVYKRLDYLPAALRSVEHQDYPNIELIVSDNGGLGEPLRETVERHYSRPYRLRQNPVTVPIAAHFNEIVQEASGEYFVMLCDDDEISANHLSTMVGLLQNLPDASLALAQVEVMDEAGLPVWRSDERRPPPPRVMSGEVFIRAWCRRQHDFVCFVTSMARTEDIRACGGYPEFADGNGIDNALVIKLAVDRKVLYAGEATFRYRVYESSLGLSVKPSSLAKATRQFLSFLDADPHLSKFAAAKPEDWKRLRPLLVDKAWKTYHGRWARMYKKRLAAPQWIAAAFAMPFIPAYYGAVMQTLGRAAQRTVRQASGIGRHHGARRRVGS